MLMLIKRFDKLLEILLGARWITATSFNHDANDINSSLKLMKCNPPNERVNCLFLGLLTKVPFSTGDLNDLGNKILNL